MKLHYEFMQLRRARYQINADRYRKQLIAAWEIFVCALLCFALIACAKVCNGAEIDDTQAVRAIIGEASNQGYDGMLAVACAIRNRGTLKGVYGIRAKHVDREPAWVWDLARRAWKESKCCDVVNGGTHWENVKAFGRPWWADKLTMVYEFKDHRFYK